MGNFDRHDYLRRVRELLCRGVPASHDAGVPAARKFRCDACDWRGGEHELVQQCVLCCPKCLGDVSEVSDGVEDVCSAEPPEGTAIGSDNKPRVNAVFYENTRRATRWLKPDSRLFLKVASGVKGDPDA